MTQPVLFREFHHFLRGHFPYKVQKISINAGFTCPNRDGTKGKGGCTYCNNQTFNPAYCRTDKSVTCQLEEGKHFFAHKPTLGKNIQSKCPRKTRQVLRGRFSCA